MVTAASRPITQDQQWGEVSAAAMGASAADRAPHGGAHAGGGLGGFGGGYALMSGEGLAGELATWGAVSVVEQATWEAASAAEQATWGAVDMAAVDTAERAGEKQRIEQTCPARVITIHAGPFASWVRNGRGHFGAAGRSAGGVPAGTVPGLLSAGGAGGNRSGGMGLISIECLSSAFFRSAVSICFCSSAA